MATYYLDPNGSDSNDGSQRSPWYSIGHAGSRVGAGDTIIVRGGTYNYTTAQHCNASGTSSNPITIQAADGATPTFSFGGRSPGGYGYDNNGGLWIGGAHWKLDGLEVQDSPYHGLVLPSGSSSVTAKNCSIHTNHLCGIKVFGSSNHTFDSCTIYDNYGSTSSGGDSDGLSLSGSNVTGITIRDCVAYYNGDDGIDLWASSGTVVRRSMSYNNGRDGGDGNGFKMGGDSASGNNTAEQCLAWRNRSNGFDYNTATPLYFYHCTSWGNGRHGFAAAGSDNVLYNNIAYQNASGNYLSNVTTSNNSWELGITDPQFADTATTNDGMEHPQDEATFLHLAEGSPCIGAGGQISGFSASGFDSTSPDLGAYPFESAAGSGVYYHDGSGWQEATVRHHDGSGWREATIRHHDGNQFV